jgi:hypothetical protein
MVCTACAGARLLLSCVPLEHVKRLLLAVHSDCKVASLSMHVWMRHRRRQRRGRRPRPIAYPPPVEGASPDSVSTLFADLGDAQWAAFVAALRRRIATALDSGAWRQGPHQPGAAKFPANMSCPRF